MARPTVTMKRMVLKDYAIHLDPILAHVHAEDVFANLAASFSHEKNASAMASTPLPFNADLLLKNRAGLLRLCPMNAVLLHLGARNSENNLNDALHLLVLQRPCRCHSRTPIPQCLEAAGPNPGRDCQ